MKSKKLPGLQELKEKIIELTEALQRERADAINLRRRAEEEKLQAVNFYKAMVIRDILPIVDNCERLLEHISADSKAEPWKNKAEPWKKGVEQIVKQCQKTLDDLGVERIKTVGEHFDPHLHEAVHMDLSSEALVKEGALAKEEGGDNHHEIISEEFQPGYVLGDEIIRPALVKVRRT